VLVWVEPNQPMLKEIAIRRDRVDTPGKNPRS